MAGRAQASALDGGKMLAHAVDLADGGAGAQQRPGHRLLVGELDPFCRQGEQRGAAAGNQAQCKVVLAQAFSQREDARRSLASADVRHRVRRLDHLDPCRRHAVAVAGDDEAFQRARPVILHGPRHGRGRLAGTHHHSAARRQLRQMRGHALGRPGACERRIQQAAQEESRIVAHASPCQSHRRASSAARQALEHATRYHAGAQHPVPARFG